MAPQYSLCIIKPNKSVFSETFIKEHIDRLSGNKKVIYGGAFPLYGHDDRLLIKSKADLLLYLIQKRILGKIDIPVRNKALSDYLKREAIDVVFAEYGMVGGLVTKACKSAGIPLVVHFHGADAHHDQTVDQYKSFYSQAFEYASGIIAVSKDMIKKLRDLGAPAEKIAYIPCGVDINGFNKIVINPVSQNFLSIGRFVEKKSPLSVVKAFEIVLRSVPLAELWMIGNGPLFREVEQYVRDFKLGKQIHLTGVLPQEEIKALMPSMRCLVQHSVTTSDGDMEGSPLTIIEAGASGLPVVSTRHAGIKEAVINNVTGFLVEEHDIQTMADRMIKIALSPQLAADMGEAGRLHIVENYSIEEQISKLDRVIENAVINRSV